MTTLCMCDLSTDEQSSTVGAYRLRAAEAVRKQLDDEEAVRSALVKKIRHAKTDEFIRAMDAARDVLKAGGDIPAAIRAGEENLRVERAFSDGPRVA